jgi:hypothetical protein
MEVGNWEIPPYLPNKQCWDTVDMTAGLPQLTKFRQMLGSILQAVKQLPESCRLRSCCRTPSIMVHREITWLAVVLLLLNTRMY